MGVTAI